MKERQINQRELSGLDNLKSYLVMNNPSVVFITAAA
jgi:hypothetical protein